MSNLRILLKHNGQVLAEADENQEQQLEGNYYIHPDCIDTRVFQTSDRIYKCPVKGTSYWVDLETPRGHLNDICWIYPDPTTEYSAIAGWYGFYPSHRRYEVVT